MTPQERRPPVARLEGVRAVSFVILDLGTSLDEPAIIAHRQRGLGSYKVPLRVLAVDDFPKRPRPTAPRSSVAGCANLPRPSSPAVACPERAEGSPPCSNS